MDINIRTEKENFRYRVGAIIKNNDDFLFITSDKSDYYYTVGGAVELMESSYDAVKREIKEELGIDCEVKNMVFVLENMFYEEVIERNFHNIEFFYVVEIEDRNKIKCESINMTNGRENIKWIKKDELKNFDIRPKMFKEKLLSNFENSFEHIVIREI